MVVVFINGNLANLIPNLILVWNSLNLIEKIIVGNMILAIIGGLIYILFIIIKPIFNNKKVSSVWLRGKYGAWKLWKRKNANTKLSIDKL